MATDASWSLTPIKSMNDADFDAGLRTGALMASLEAIEVRGRSLIALMNFMVRRLVVY